MLKTPAIFGYENKISLLAYLYAVCINKIEISFVLVGEFQFIWYEQHVLSIFLKLIFLKRILVYAINQFIFIKINRIKKNCFDWIERSFDWYIHFLLFHSKLRL